MTTTASSTEIIVCYSLRGPLLLGEYIEQQVAEAAAAALVCVTRTVTADESIIEQTHSIDRAGLCESDPEEVDENTIVRYTCEYERENCPLSEG